MNLMFPYLYSVMAQPKFWTALKTLPGKKYNNKISRLNQKCSPKIFAFIKEIWYCKEDLKTFHQDYFRTKYNAEKIDGTIF